MNDFVTNMHRSSGLIEEMPDGVTLEEAERLSLEYIRRFVPTERKAPLAGNTIGTDRMFLAKYMPAVDEFLHYRNVDVSSIKEVSRRWFPRAYFQAPAKDGGHRALADILESIRELELLPHERCSSTSPVRRAIRRATSPASLGVVVRLENLIDKIGMSAPPGATMVAVAQLVEHRVVVAGVAGSSPVSHPICARCALSTAEPVEVRTLFSFGRPPPRPARSSAAPSRSVHRTVWRTRPAHRCPRRCRSR